MQRVGIDYRRQAGLENLPEHGLRKGDLVFTGTPEGVGPLAPGDVVEIEVDAARDPG